MDGIGFTKGSLTPKNYFMVFSGMKRLGNAVLELSYQSESSNITELYS